MGEAKVRRRALIAMIEPALAALPDPQIMQGFQAAQPRLTTRQLYSIAVANGCPPPWTIPPESPSRLATQVLDQAGLSGRARVRARRDLLGRP